MSGRGIAIGGGGIGVIVLVIAVILCGGDPRSLLEQMPQQNQPTQQQPQARQNGKTDENSEFVSVVLGSTEDVWNDVFRKSGIRYKEPKLVLFTGQVRSACGFADAAMGPFYCPGDQKLYLDFAFFGELEREFKAPGDFAQAYVIAHEVGHHVQNLLGTMDKVTSAQRSAGKSEANRLSVRLELQADCFAGAWAAAVFERGLLDRGDIEEALSAAQAVGDDRIQEAIQGRVNPESFTHGTSDQRVRWFSQGYDTGDPNTCDTFGGGI